MGRHKRPSTRPVARQTHCRGCGERKAHHLLFEPAAFHALGTHRKVFCDACGGLALYVPASMTGVASPL